MTVRYTAIEGMEEPSLRDVDRNAERWRDKIEVRLDNRQVFFLFFGSAVVACMLFVLGVMVGKRIESRGQAASPELQDPLAALDRAHTPVAGVAPAPAPQLTFANTLIGTSARPPKATKLAALTPAPVPKPMPLAAPIKPIAPAAAAAPQPPKPIALAAPPKVAAPTPKMAAAPPMPASKAAAALTTTAPKQAATPTMTTPKQAAAVAATDASKGRGKFTLHLSTFASADEANAFAQHYPGAFVVAGDVPGRGMAYRVRYGNFPTYKDATSAKDSFEKQHNVIALVAAR
jgi:septal ring-binding cell division protein DamX